MSVTYKTGDIFTSTQPAFGQGVNVFFDMNSGMNAKFRQAFGVGLLYPYLEACFYRKLKVGGMLPVYIDADEKWVFNLAVQKLSFSNPKLGWFEAALEASFKFAQEKELTGFAIPQIGAGAPDFRREGVKARVEEIASKYPEVELEVWTPAGK
jgi:O-acetyl-ADP-ribose deacetylase (regulator of RNase III)